jgi:hypothetical protein
MIPSSYTSGVQPISIFGDIMSAILGRSASAAPSTSAAPSASLRKRRPRHAEQQLLSLRPRQRSMSPPCWTGSRNKKTEAQLANLMKLLDLDSSATACEHLAEELHYQGDMKKSAQMNVWLRKQVMIKLAENGGKVPAELKRQPSRPLSAA